MVERQVRYNLKTDIEAQALARHEWIFCIINEPREIGRIRERIFNQLRPVELEYLNDLGSTLIEGSGGLHYDFFTFSSQQGRMRDPSKIYDSKKFKLDRDLVRRDIVGLLQYLKPIVEGRKK